MENNKTVRNANKMPAKKSDASAPAPAKTAAASKVVVAAPPPAPAAAAAPSVKKETKAKAPKVASKVETVVPTVEAPVVVVESVEGSEALLASLGEKLKALGTEFTTKVRDAVKNVHDAIKATKREARDSKKKKNPADMTPEERKTWEARRANNAFLVQRPLTDELCVFMGLPSGSKRSQTEVTKFISAYVKTHSCFDPTFKRRILPNAALAKLLRVADKDEVTYLNLQTYLKVHFVKAPVA